MKHQSKFSAEQQQSQQTGVEHQTQQQPAVREFAGPEELLRYDAARTTVPPGIAQRLQKSTGDAPAPKGSWWKRWLGGQS